MSARPRTATLGRRAFLGSLGAGAGLLLGGGWRPLLGSSRAQSAAIAELDFDACLARLDASLSPGQRALTVRPFDHPARQITNTISVFRSPHIGTLFDAEQTALIERLYHTMVSDRGRDWLHHTITLEGRLDACVLSLFSDEPAGSLATGKGRTQAMINGGHLMLRRGAEARSGYAFGGPISYGQQLGNGRYRVEGNAFAAHGDAANRFYEALDPDARRRSLVPSPPNELMVQPLGAAARPDGVSLASTTGPAREAAEELVETVLATYEADARSDARSCLEENGGIDALSVCFYADKGFYADGSRFSESAKPNDSQELPYWHVWRIEGPGCVIHFKGWPHVHAYIDIVRDPTRQNVGEALTHAPAALEGRAVQRLLTAALRAETDEALAWMPEDAPGRVCPGEVTTGVAWALDPYGNDVVVATIRGDAMAPALREGLGIPVEPAREVRVATTAYPATRRDLFGSPSRVETGSRTLRAALVDFLRDRDLGSFLDA